MNVIDVLASFILACGVLTGPCLAHVQFDGVLNRDFLMASTLEHQDSLIFNGKHVKSIEPDCFVDFPDIWKLYLENNQIAKLDANVFIGLRNLSWLLLNNNQLSQLGQHVFDGLSNLTWLVLNNNKLSSLHPKVFGGLRNLTVLKLDYNQLTTLDPKIFHGLFKLAWLKLVSSFLHGIQLSYWVNFESSRFFESFCLTIEFFFLRV
jgi:hypothetical protein